MKLEFLNSELELELWLKIKRKEWLLNHVLDLKTYTL